MYKRQIKDKSRSTKVIANTLFAFGFFVLSYVVASTFYHPFAAFHRWSTVLFVLIVITLFMQAFFEFPEPRHTKLARISLRVMLLITMGFVGWFMAQTLEASFVYHFEGHYYDFDADEASYVISVAIIGYITLLMGIGIWRISITKGRERWTVLGILLGIMLSSFVPAYLNTLSREGGMDRGTCLLYTSLPVLPARAVRPMRCT